MRHTAIQFMLLLSWACAGAAQAIDVAPDALFSAATQEVSSVVARDREVKLCNPVRISNLVETRIFPHFDLDRMTQDAVARNWRLATPAQQRALGAEFRTLLLQTYVTTLLGYRDHPIEFKRLRAASGDTEVTVRSLMKRPGLDPLSIDYEMEQQSSGWRVYDVKIAGVSLVATYREAFAGTVRATGIDGLIATLAERNSQERSREGDFRFDPYQRENFPLMFAIVQRIIQTVR